VSAPFAAAAIIFLAVLVQSFIGFGSAIVAMIMLPRIIPLHVAAPLTVLLGLVVEIVLLSVFRQSLNLKEVQRFTFATILGIPLGIFLLIRVPERTSLAIIGVIIFLYAIYGLFNLRIPPFKHRGWAYALGLVAGAMGGAYTILGPPIILYGHGKQWSSDQFKANLQAFFFISSIAILVGYIASGSVTAQVWHLFWFGLPAVLLAIGIGLWLGKKVNPQVFQKGVLIGMAVLGISLVG